MLIDSHCHLEKFYRRGNLDEVINEASLAGVNRMVTIGTSTDDWDLYHQLSTDYPGKIYHTVGLHPCEVSDDWEAQVEKLNVRLKQGDVAVPVGIGEIGLDYFHLPQSEKERESAILRQKAAFRAQLEIASFTKLPIIIHSRNAFDDCVKMIDASGAVWDRVVFHCFSEGKEQIDRINLRGGRGSFTGIITYDKANVMHVCEALVEQGVERLMIETDCPYLSPQPHRGKENRPAYLRHTFQKVASLLQVPVVELETMISRSTCAFFGIES